MGLLGRRRLQVGPLSQKTHSALVTFTVAYSVSISKVDLETQTAFPQVYVSTMMKDARDSLARSLLGSVYDMYSIDVKDSAGNKLRHYIYIYVYTR